MTLRLHPAIEGLRARIARVERSSRQPAAVLSLGVAGIDMLLPGGGLALGALHEVTGAGRGNGDAAAAMLFCAGLAARASGPALWCVAQPDLFAPGLAQAGLQPDQVIFVEAHSDKALLACCEEGLAAWRVGSCGGGIVAAADDRVTAPATAAESSGTLALVLRRWAGRGRWGSRMRRIRWRIAALPSARLPTPGIGLARWQLELLRSRNGATRRF